MSEYINNAVQNISLNNPILFDTSIPCRKGYIFHEDGTGIFILKGITNNCFARYQMTFNGNIAIPEGGVVTPIAIDITVNGEARPSSRAVFTPSAVDVFGNVTSTCIITVPNGCCFTAAVRYIDATTNDAATTPTPSIEVENSNLVISRIA